MPEINAASDESSVQRMHQEPVGTNEVPKLGEENRNMNFLMAAMTMAMFETMKVEEKPKSFKWNRLNNAVDVSLRVCDIYLPSGINSTALNKVWEILDGEVTDVLKRRANELYDAVALAAQTTQEA